MSSSTAFAVKSVYQGDFRRFKLPRPSFELLRQSLAVSYPTLPSNFTIKYTDDEGDLCLITSDMELAEAAQVATKQSSSLKVTVFANKSPASTDVLIQDEKEELVRELGPVKEEVKESPVKEPIKESPIKEPIKESPIKEEPLPVKEPVKEEACQKEKKIPSPETDTTAKLDELLDLAFQAVKDTKVQSALPRAIEAALGVLRQGATSFEVIVDTALSAAASLKENPSIQKLLPLVPRVSPVVNRWIEKGKAFLPVLITMAQQYVALLPQLLQKVDFDALKKCLKEKFEKGAHHGLCVFDLHLPDAPPFALDLHVDIPLTEQKGEKEEQTHRNIKCDGCGMFPIIGIRYKCTVCTDFDLCATCEAKDVHTTSHALLKIKEPPRADIHFGVTCDGCSVSPIQGTRYKCTVCPNYDLCDSCEAENKHPAGHPLIKLKVAADIPVRRGRFGGFRGRCLTRRCHRSHSKSKEQPMELPQPTELSQPQPTELPQLLEVSPLPKEVPPLQPKEMPSTEQKQEHPQPTEKSLPQEAPQRPTAHFVRDVNLPDGVGVAPGEVLKKSWEFLNPLTTAWPEGSKLVFSQGSKELLVDSEEFSLPIARPGEKVQVSCPIRVPTKPGRFQASFVLVDKDRVPFEGHRCWVELMIAEDDKKSTAPEPKVDPIAPKTETVSPSKTEPTTIPPKVDPKVTEPAKPKEEKAKAKGDDIDPALKEKYKYQLKALEDMGFSQLSLNVFLLQKYKGSVERTVAGLLEMAKSR